MKKIIEVFSLLTLTLLILSGCTSSQKSSAGIKKDSTNISNQIPPDTTLTENKSQTVNQGLSVKYYIVQIGAFTTKDRAEKFTKKSRDVLHNKIDIVYNKNINLYVVQLSPFYSSRAEAEKEKNMLWKMPGYKDAWIVTVTK